MTGRIFITRSSRCSFLTMRNVTCSGRVLDMPPGSAAALWMPKIGRHSLCSAPPNQGPNFIPSRWKVANAWNAFSSQRPRRMVPGRPMATDYAAASEPMGPLSVFRWKAAQPSTSPSLRAAREPCDLSRGAPFIFDVKLRDIGIGTTRFRATFAVQMRRIPT